MAKKASSGDLVATLKKRRAEALVTIAAAEKAKALVAEIDAVLAKLVELAGEPAPVKAAPPPENVLSFEENFPEAVAKPSRHKAGYPALVLAILKRTPDQPVQAKDIIEEIAKGMDPVPSGKPRRVLDVSVRNAISNLYQDPASGVSKVSYGYYRWKEPGAAAT